MREFNGGTPSVVLPGGPVDDPADALESTALEMLRHASRMRLAMRQVRAAAPARSSWMTPPAAAKATGVPVKSVRAWIRCGRITKRLKNLSASPKQLKYLVNVNEVEAAAEQRFSDSAERAVASTEVQPESVRDRAREILAARASRER